MAISYLYPPTGETTEKEPWRWVAVYNDKTELQQFEVSEKGAIFHRSSEIDATKLDELQLQHDSYQTITVKVPAEAEVVHFYRHRTVQELLNQGDEGESLQREWKFKIWCIGFRIKQQYWLVFVDEYGKTVYTNDKQLFAAKLAPPGLNVE